jgi:hypothetical protein
MHLPEFTLLAIATVSAIVAGFGVGMLALGRPRFGVVRVLFWISALTFASLGIVWSATSSDHPLWVQMVVAGTIGAIAFAGLAWGLWEVRHQEKIADEIVRPEAPPRVPKSEFPPSPPASPPKSEKTDKSTVVDEADLIGTARLLYNAEENRLDVLKYEKIRSIVVEPVTPGFAISYAQSFRITFAFYPYQGPFDVRISTTGYSSLGSMQPGLSYFVTENEDRFVIVTASRGPLSIPQSHEAFFRFYRKH